MKRSLRIGLAVVAVGVVIAGFGSAWGVHHRQDRNEVAPIAEKMKTVCVGRFLIDLPGEAQISLGGTNIDGFDISAFDETKEEFQQRVAEREAQLIAAPERPGGGKKLESVMNVDSASGLVGKIFMHSRTVDEGTQANGLEIERYRYEGITTEALVHSHCVSVDLSSENRGIEWMNDLPKLVSKLVTNPDSRIPKEPGFCTDRAYFRDPLTADQGERLTMFARLPSHPDIDFMLILSAGLKPDAQGLLKRSRSSGAWLSLLQRMRVSTLRAARRKLAGLPGEELVRSVVEDNDARVYTFRWEVNGTEDNVLIPHFVFTMHTGNADYGPVQSSLSADAALALWDKILSSIRIRPVEQNKRGAPVPASVAAR